MEFKPLYAFGEMSHKLRQVMSTSSTSVLAGFTAQGDLRKMESGHSLVLDDPSLGVTVTRRRGSSSESPTDISTERMEASVAGSEPTDVEMLSNRQVKIRSSVPVALPLALQQHDLGEAEEAM